MKTVIRTSWLLGLATLSLASGAFAGTVTFTLTGVTGASLAGVYTSPYIATISSNPGVSVFAICDNWETESYLNTPFVATVTNVASLTGPTASTDVKFDQTNPSQQQKDYVTAAYLVKQLLGVDQSTTAGRTMAGELSFAIWGLFYTPAFNALGVGSTLYDNARSDLLAAQNATQYQTTGDYADVDIYTPWPNKAASQEFLVVRTPEPAAVAILALNMLALMSLVFLFRKRLVRVN